MKKIKIRLTSGARILYTKYPKGAEFIAYKSEDCREAFVFGNNTWGYTNDYEVVEIYDDNKQVELKSLSDIIGNNPKEIIIKF